MAWGAKGRGRSFGPPAWVLPVAVGLAALLPLVLFHRQFARLFWFGDEFPLMDEIDVMPFGKWLWWPFVENVLPLFKLLWGGILVKISGSYFTMLCLAWAVHGANAALIALWMRRSAFRLAAIIWVAILFAWSASQIETVTWTVQISSELATLFFLLGALAVPARSRPVTAATCLVLFTCSLGSAWSFSRGLLTGPVLAWSMFGQRQSSRRSRATAALCCLLPTLATAGLMLAHAPADSGHLASDLHHLKEVAAFALCYLGANPAVPFWYSTGHGNVFAVAPSTAVIAGLIKVALVIAGWSWASVPQRKLLLPLLLLDVGYALLLGLGRWSGGWPCAMASRYQYNALLSTLPFIAVVLTRGLRPFFGARRAQAAAILALAGLFAAFSLFAWSSALPGWTEWRGVRNRQLLLQARPNLAGADVQGVPGFPNWRAAQLVAKYRLR